MAKGFKTLETEIGQQSQEATRKADLQYHVIRYLGGLALASVGPFLVSSDHLKTSLSGPSPSQMTTANQSVSGVVLDLPLLVGEDRRLLHVDTYGWGSILQLKR